MARDDFTVTIEGAEGHARLFAVPDPDDVPDRDAPPDRRRPTEAEDQAARGYRTHTPGRPEHEAAERMVADMIRQAIAGDRPTGKGTVRYAGRDFTATQVGAVVRGVLAGAGPTQVPGSCFALWFLVDHVNREGM
jgi:hypothetical protein